VGEQGGSKVSGEKWGDDLRKFLSGIQWRVSLLDLDYLGTDSKVFCLKLAPSDKSSPEALKDMASYWGSHWSDVVPGHVDWRMDYDLCLDPGRLCIRGEVPEDAFDISDGTKLTLLVGLPDAERLLEEHGIEVDPFSFREIVNQVDSVREKLGEAWRHAGERDTYRAIERIKEKHNG
jgi:hypothetical protein